MIFASDGGYSFKDASNRCRELHGSLRFGWTVRDEGVVVADNIDTILRYSGITLLGARYLEYAGLVHLNTNVKVPLRKGDVLKFFDHYSETVARDVGLVGYPLTDVGFELMSLAGATPSLPYLAYSKPLVQRTFAL